jgi:hypothetical protein
MTTPVTGLHLSHKTDYTCDHTTRGFKSHETAPDTKASQHLSHMPTAVSISGYAREDLEREEWDARHPLAKNRMSATPPVLWPEG